MLVYLLELDYLDPASGETGTLCFTTAGGGWCSGPADDPPDRFYEPRLQVALNYERRVFRDGITPGCGEGGYGTATIAIPDGRLDHYKRLCFDNRGVRSLAGDRAWPRSAFRPLVTGLAAAPEFHQQTMTVKLRDYVQRYRNPLSRNVYLGNNADGVGVEGDTELMGKTKPIALGRLRDIPLVLVSESDDIYQAHDGPMQAFEALRADGVPLDILQDCADLAALRAAAVSGGQAVTCAALGLLRAPGQASATLTADVRGAKFGGVYVEDLAGLLRAVSAHLIRMPRTNLIRHSEALGNAVWAASGLTAAPDASVAFPGSMSVWRLTEGTGTGGHLLAQTLDCATGIHCFSVHVRPAGRSRVLLRVARSGNPADNVAALFDITAEGGMVLEIQTNGSALGGAYDEDGWLADAWVDALPGGWIRCSVAGQPYAGQFAQLTASLELLADDSAQSYAGDGSSGVHAAGAQLELAASPSRYAGPTALDAVTAYDPEEEIAFDEDSLAALAAACPQPVGFFTAAGSADTAAEVCDALCGGLQAGWGFTRAGLFRAGRLRALTGSEPVKAVFTRDTIKEDTLDWSAPFSSADGAPPYRVSLSGVRNWTVRRKSELAEIVAEQSPAYARWAGEEYRTARREDPSVLARHPAACALAFVSQLAVLADVNAQARALFAFYASGLERFTFAVVMNRESGVFDLDFLDVVTVVYDRFGLDEGRNFLVLGVTEQEELDEAVIEVLG